MFELLLLIAIVLIVILYALIRADEQVKKQDLGRKQRIYDKLS